MTEPQSTDDLDRLRQEYAARASRLVGSDIYSHFNPAYLFALQQLEISVLRVLRRHGFSVLEGRRILEVGCGKGGVLFKYLEYGATLSLLHGVDILGDDRLYLAHNRLPNACITQADGQFLPYPDNTFDLVMQYTALSSILDAAVKANVASEMLRVVRSRGDGMILWYDFWLNPFNSQTHGIRPKEIKRLFPDCSFEFHQITLAPPLTRRLVPISWLFCAFLEKLKFLNSHYLVVIKPNSITSS
jgi:ubiquinone/menaquinone biosynthesis C-methylase UbiE